ncbi:hypothetical protein [Clostridium sp. BSD9I1]|uniref:hypothetical protein n=1 Tax=Clostridium sp. BSD9I1 TaxID=2003589 RepID=UPI0016461508|nr:hypothetical protein [Clostridium sp. BSD9I1]
MMHNKDAMEIGLSSASLCKLSGRAKIDLKSLFLKLKDMNYKGPGIIEVYSENYNKYDEIIESRDFLKKYII